MSDRGDAQLVIRPSWKSYKQMVTTAPAFLIVIIVVFSVRNGLTGFLVAGGTFALCVLGAAIYFINADITMTPSAIIRKNFLGMKIVSQRSDIGTVVRVILPVAVADSRMYQNLFVLDKEGDSIVRLKSTHWAEGDIDKFVQQLSMPTVDYTNPATLGDFKKQYPKALPMMERRPFLWSCLVVAIILVAVIVFAIIVVAAGDN